MQKLDLQGGRALTGIETGFHDLDDRTRGLQPGELIVLASRPSVGKSALALNIAEHVAVDTAGQAVAFFSLEMSKEELALRLLSSRAKVDGQKLRKGTLSNTEVQRIQDVADYLDKAPLYIDDTQAISLDDILARAHQQVRDNGAKLVVIDYLHLIEPLAETAPYEKMSQIASSLKALARRLEVPILALAQLRRESEEHQRPRMADLRDSGFLEEAADVILFLHREAMRPSQGTKEYDQVRGEAELIIGKQRNGPTDTLKLTWQREYTRFQTWSPREAPTGYNVEQYETTPAGVQDVRAADDEETPF